MTRAMAKLMLLLMFPIMALVIIIEVISFILKNPLLLYVIFIVVPCFFGSIAAYKYISPGNPRSVKSWKSYSIFGILALITVSGCPAISLVMRDNDKVCDSRIRISYLEVDEYREAGYSIDNSDYYTTAAKCYPRYKYYETQTALSLDSRSNTSVSSRPETIPTTRPTERPTTRPVPTPKPVTTPTTIVATKMTGQVMNGGNMRTEIYISPQTVIGQVCPGDQIEFISQKTPLDTTWYYIRVIRTGNNCDPNRVPVNTTGWVSSMLLSNPLSSIPEFP